MKKSIMIYVLMVMATIVAVNIFAVSKPVEASENREREKVVISISIEEGDTLWSIAAKYYTDEYDDMNAFINEIKKCNGISDEIKIGQKILIPCHRNVL